MKSLSFFISLRKFLNQHSNTSSSQSKWKSNFSNAAKLLHACSQNFGGIMCSQHMRDHAFSSALDLTIAAKLKIINKIDLLIVSHLSCPQNFLNIFVSFSRNILR